MATSSGFTTRSRDGPRSYGHSTSMKSRWTSDGHCTRICTTKPRQPRIVLTLRIVESITCLFSTACPSSSPARLTALTIQKQKTYGKSRFHVLNMYPSFGVDDAPAPVQGHGRRAAPRERSAPGACGKDSGSQVGARHRTQLRAVGARATRDSRGGRGRGRSEEHTSELQSL